MRASGVFVPAETVEAEIRVKNSFNDINASMRMRQAQAEKAEADDADALKALQAQLKGCSDHLRNLLECWVLNGSLPTEFI